jgi:hypothetical protein
MLGDWAGKISALATIFGLLLLISLFLPWAQIVCELEPCEYPSGWQVLSVLDVPIAILAVVAAVLGLVVMLRRVPLAALALALAGVVAIVLVWLAPVVEDESARPVDFGGSYFLGMLGALGVIAAGLTMFFMIRDSGDDEEGEEANGES